MVQLNSTTAILSDLDGVILNIDYDIKFWESWLPEYIASQSSLTEEEAKAEILSKGHGWRLSGHAIHSFPYQQLLPDFPKTLAGLA